MKKKTKKIKYIRKVAKKVVKVTKPEFIYGDIIFKGKVIHQYEPDVTLEKYFFKKFDVTIEAIDIKEAKVMIEDMFE